MEDILKYENRDQLYHVLINEFGLTKLKERYDEENFGNFSIVLSANDFLLNYVNDRSFLTIEIASKSDPSNWYDLSFIKDYIYNPDQINQQSGDLDNNTRIKELNIFLMKDFNIISELFNSNNYPDTRKKVDQLLKERFNRAFK